MTSVLLRRAALPLAVAGACLAMGLAAQAAQSTGGGDGAESAATGEGCAGQVRGRFNDRCAADPRARDIDGVDRVPATAERELPKLTVLLGDERAPRVERTARTATEPGASVERGDRHTPRFASGEDGLSDADRARLDAIAARVRGRPGLRFEIVGHTDPQPIAPALRPRFPDNQALGLARAQRVGRYLAQQLGLDDSAFSATSKGPDEPVATPAGDRANWAANRRVEVRVYWQEQAPPRTVALPAEEKRVDPTVCAALTPPDAADAPVRITVDGQPLDGAGMSGADHQRCTDVRLEQDRLRLQYDSLSAQRRLNAAAWPAAAVPGETVSFAGYSNYRLYLLKAELRIFRADGTLQPHLLATVPLDAALRAQWRVPADLAAAAPARLYYRLRVYDRAGRFDETDDIPLGLAERRRPQDEETPDALRQRLMEAYGSSRLAVTNIAVRGGTVTASGEGIARDQRVRALGFDVPVDDNGRFALQELVPRQVSSGEIAVIHPDGREQVYRRVFELPRQDFFLVGQADLTLGRNHTSGPAALVTGDRNRYQNDTWSEGRIAFYGKGQLDERWTLTASVDTEERALKDMLRNLDRKDPASLFRRIDPVDSWGTFGDDSTTIEDAPTQGRMYVRVDDGRSHALWGNYKLTLGQDTTLSQVNRGLYGLHARHVGEESTDFGDAKLRVDLYAAEPGTLAAREEFRGTGGSLYYLRHQDVSRGAEKAYVEIRDRDSGMVLQRRALIPGTDYEVDYLQGRVLLTSPLASTADATALLATLSGYAGQPVYLVVDYEYLPAAGASLDTLATGGRVAWWATDGVRLGVTASRQRQTGGDQRLAGVDLLLRRSDLSWVKVEASRSEGPGTLALQSLDGGFNFAGAALGDTVAANAWRVEGQAELADYELASRGRVAAYAQQRGAGFSAPGQLATNETRQAGASATFPVGEATDVRLKADHKDEVRGYNTDAAEAQATHRLDEHWTVSGGLRLDRKGTDAVNTSPLLPTTGVVQGERTDAIARLEHDSGEGWGLYGFVQKTLNHTGTRQENDRVGLGGRYQVSDRLALRSELSTGDGGGGGKAGADFQYDDRTNLYMTYARDTGRTDETLNARGATLVGGVKSRVTDNLNVYSEQRQSSGVQSGLVSAYGLQWAVNDRWTLSATTEQGRIEYENAGALKREAQGLTVGYVHDGLRWAGGVETRRDASALETRRSWLLKNSASLQDGPDGRWLGKLNWADSDSSGGTAAGARYTEAVLGYAWRPVLNDRLNMLFKYTWLYDLSSPGQLAAGQSGNGIAGTTVAGTLPVVGGTGIDYQQRSQVLAVDATYDLNARWSVGGKLARRVGELRPSRDDSAAWFKSTADLVVARVDWKLLRQWDWLLELRTLRAAELAERRSGLLTAGYYHLNENVKVGLGYNFTDFSDNLTDLSYRSRGVFLNVLSKF